MTFSEGSTQKDFKGNGQKPKNDLKPTLFFHLTIADLIKKAMNAANGNKFSRLWQGNISGYESQSEADSALCSMLFHSGQPKTQSA